MYHKGLTPDEVLKQREKYGSNTINSKNKHSRIYIFLKQLQSPLIFILIFAAIISMFLGEFKDAVFISIVVVLNSVLGFYQENKAENTLEKLRSRVASYVKVIRDGKRKEVETQELVPQDLVVLESGLKVPGDGFILEATELQLNESLITGESRPIYKKAIKTDRDKKEEDYQVKMGSAVVQGLGIAQITKTGNDTYYGKIAQNLTENIDPTTPTKERLYTISKFITYIILIMIFVVIGLGLFRGFDFEEILLTAVALAVSVIPEGLVVSFTVVLALGMNRIMAKKSIVKNLPAAETLGNIDVLCADKTGTLTLGQMKVDGYEIKDLEKSYYAIALVNNGTNYIDDALAQFVKEEKSFEYWNNVQSKRKNIFPFSSKTKFTGAYDGGHIYAIGAPEVILNFSKKQKKDWNKIITETARQGKRLVAVAMKKVPKSNISRKDFVSMDFLGLIYVTDPVRESAKASIEKIEKAGIDLKIITGDLKETTMSVLSQLDINLPKDQIVFGHDFAKLRSDKKIDEVVATAKLFYRTTPEQKLQIVDSLQRQGMKVAMMGDGINDSPALKKAEIGISVDSATDVSKEVSDLILLDTNFQTIVDAIEEGRNIFHNFRKIFVNLLADSLTEVLLILLALIVGTKFLPFVPLQLLWINLIVDGLPSLALSFDKADDKNLLSSDSKPSKSGIFGKTTLITLGIVSAFTHLLFFMFFLYIIDNGYDQTRAQTMMFGGIAISSLLFVFSAKTIDTNIWKKNIFDNKILNFSILLGFILLFAAIYVPFMQGIFSTVSLNVFDLTTLIGLSFINIIIIELAKSFMHSKIKS